MRKIRVVEYVDALGFGGTEKVLYLFCKYINREQFDISVCTVDSDKRSGREQSIRDIGVDIHFTPRSRNALQDYFVSVKPDILHIHRLGNTQRGVITAAKNAGVPIIVEHNIFGYVDESEENRLIDCHIFISYSCGWRYQMWTGRPLLSPEYEILYYPLEINCFDQFDFTKRDFTKKAIGRIGRTDNQKWDFEFIKALPLIVRAIPELEFHVIGITPEVHDAFRAWGCERNLILYPLSTDEDAIMRFYSNISVMAHFASIGETFGLVFAEAMAARLPVVTHYAFNEEPFKDSAQSELINHGFNGYVAIDHEMYAESVIKLLSEPELCRKTGLQGYVKARSCYDAAVITRGLEDIFMNLVMERGLVL